MGSSLPEGSTSAKERASNSRFRSPPERNLVNLVIVRGEEKILKVAKNVFCTTMTVLFTVGHVVSDGFLAVDLFAKLIKI